MAATTSSNSSFVEGIQRIAGQIAQLKFLPDADPQFIDALEQTIVQYVQAKQQQQAQQQSGQNAQLAGLSSAPQGGGGGLAALAGMGGGMGGGGDMGGMDPSQGMGGPPSPMGGGMGGGMNGFGGGNAPNADELRRILSPTSGG